MTRRGGADDKNRGSSRCSSVRRGRVAGEGVAPLEVALLVFDQFGRGSREMVGLLQVCVLAALIYRKPRPLIPSTSPVHPLTQTRPCVPPCTLLL